MNTTAKLSAWPEDERDRKVLIRLQFKSDEELLKQLAGALRTG